MQTNRDERFLTRLNQHPSLRERIETLLDIVDDVTGDCTKADAAEQAVLDEVRKLGQAALQGWATHAVPRATATARQQQPALQGNGEKKSGGIRSSGSLRSANRSCEGPTDK
jgi:predicted signal transduction protein with EAL and GGDEF domain